MENVLTPFASLPLPRDVIADLRSDHAGETGAVAIYQGILAVSRDDGVRTFAMAHMDTERRHCEFFNAWLPQSQWSGLLPVWYASGWCLGAFAALLGPQSVFRTIDAVESFVERHYNEQIQKLSQTPELRPLASCLQAFCDDESEHRTDAVRRHDRSPSVLHRGWLRIVGAVSAIGVAIARRV